MRTAAYNTAYSFVMNVEVIAWHHCFAIERSEPLRHFFSTAIATISLYGCMICGVGILFQYTFNSFIGASSYFDTAFRQAAAMLHVGAEQFSRLWAASQAFLLLRHALITIEYALIFAISRWRDILIDISGARRCHLGFIKNATASPINIMTIRNYLYHRILSFFIMPQSALYLRK